MRSSGGGSAALLGNLYDKLGFKKPYNPPIKGPGRQRSSWPNLCGATVRFLQPPFFILLPPRKQAKPCRRILSTIDTTPSCCWSHLPLYHISLDRESGVVGALYVCISQRRRHLRRWIGSDCKEETASTTISSTFCWTFPLCDFFKGMKISSVSLVDYIF
jgi:hypothetical protein